jgi:hypothetical protein
VDEALAGMAKTGAPRQPIGTEVVDGTRNASAAVTTGTRPKGNKAAGDPSIMDNGQRKNVPVDRMGACYGIRASISMPGPAEAAATTRNGRLMGPATVRSGFKQESGGW